jgi:DNA-binding transcriptional MerR regulator
MTGEFSLESLAAEVQKWTDRHRIHPANGQTAEEITERTIRYYRTLGLLDPPAGGYVKMFSEKHKLQLIAIRIYQSQGLPLRRIRDELYGQSLEDLRALEKQAAMHIGKPEVSVMPFSQPTKTESWAVVPLAADFLLVSRNHQSLPRVIVDKINQLLLSVIPDKETEIDSKRN